MNQSTTTPGARLAEILQEAGALLIGDFELKNGEHSDFFIDFGRISSGDVLQEVGKCYAGLIEREIGLDHFDVVFGPAVKGIPLAIATSMALCAKTGVRKGYSFNRLWPKEYGETGLFLGQPLDSSTRVLMVDDVLTDGRTKQDAIELIRGRTGATVVAVVVGVDRSAEPGVVERFEREAGIPLRAIVSREQVQLLVAQTVAF